LYKENKWPHGFITKINPFIFCTSIVGKKTKNKNKNNKKKNPSQRERCERDRERQRDI
jgi:hypothetical protein